MVLRKQHNYVFLQLRAFLTVNVEGGRFLFSFDFILRAVSFLNIKKFYTFGGMVPIANGFTLGAENK